MAHFFVIANALNGSLIYYHSHLDPEQYLKYLFEKLPNTANLKDAETLDQYLPWATKTQEKYKE